MHVKLDETSVVVYLGVLLYFRILESKVNNLLGFKQDFSSLRVIDPDIPVSKTGVNSS